MDHRPSFRVPPALPGAVHPVVFEFVVRHVSKGAVEGAARDTAQREARGESLSHCTWSMPRSKPSAPKTGDWRPRYAPSVSPSTLEVFIRISDTHRDCR